MNLLEVFKNMPEYTILKIRGDFPGYKSGQDIDIVCRDLEAVNKYLMDYFLGYWGWRMNRRDDKHIHLDFMDMEKLLLRFDLYSEFISPRFTEDILDQKMLVKYGDYEIWIASYHQDILIKAWEYHTNKKKKYKKYKDFYKGLDAYKDR